jgi:hypothetical protein
MWCEVLAAVIMQRPGGKLAVASYGQLAWPILRPWRWRQYVHQKRLWTCDGLHGITSQKSVVSMLRIYSSLPSLRTLKLTLRNKYAKSTHVIPRCFFANLHVSLALIFIRYRSNYIVTIMLYQWHNQKYFAYISINTHYVETVWKKFVTLTLSNM